MKKFAAATMLALTLFVTGCQTSTAYGDCQGIFTESDKNPNLEYHYSTRNIVLAVIFSGSLLWPVLTAGLWLECPTGPKAAPAGK